MCHVDGRQPRRGRFRQDHRDIERAGSHDDRPAAAGAAHDGHTVRPATFDADVIHEPARRTQHHGVIGRLPEPEHRFAPPRVGLDQEGLVERQVFGNARAANVVTD